jgi:hypothetical protein
MTTFYFALIYICQAILLIFYALYPATEYKNFFQSLFPTKKHLALVNVACAISIFSINRLGQFFCVPVAWASVILILFALSMVLYPFFEKDNWIKKGVGFLQGIGFLVCLYCIFFYNLGCIVAAIMAAIFGLMVLIPSYILSFIVLKILKKEYTYQSFRVVSTPALFPLLTVLLPYFWLLQIIQQFFNNDEKYQKKMYYGLFSMLFITFFFIKACKNVLNNRTEIAQQNEVVIRNLQESFFDNYMLERAIGWGLVYHLETCIYDGWRPPMHDPFLVVSEWVWREGEPITHIFNEKKMLYEKFFPNVRYKKKCSCAIEESETYFKDMDNL